MAGGLLRSESGDREGEIDGGFLRGFFESLPEGFVADALGLTCPRDVCRLALVNTIFRAAAEWDMVWEKFLPANYEKILAEAVNDGGGDGAVVSGSKKEVYLRLCDQPVIIDGGNKSFSLEKWSGKNIYMLAPRDLSIIWGDTPRYWRWISLPDSRFAEVAELVSVCWLEISGSISTSKLSPDTCYAAYLVYKLSPVSYGFEDQPVEVSLGISEAGTQTKTVSLDPATSWQALRYNNVPGRRLFNRVRHLVNRPRPGPGLDLPNGPKPRQDGWLEIELGERFIEKGQEGELEMSIREVNGGNWKGGLTVQGIEIRPKAP